VGTVVIEGTVVVEDKVVEGTVVAGTVVVEGKVVAGTAVAVELPPAKLAAARPPVELERSVKLPMLKKAHVQAPSTAALRAQPPPGLNSPHRLWPVA
jgi:hypothetical protein